MDILDAFERNLQATGADMQPLVETRQALEKLVSRMDGLESTFDRIVERSRM